jgi:hypothetical protein
MHSLMRNIRLVQLSRQCRQAKAYWCHFSSVTKAINPYICDSVFISTQLTEKRNQLQIEKQTRILAYRVQSPKPERS